MTIKNADMPAMPLTDEQIDNFGSVSSSEFCGLTKREHIAAMAMQGFITAGVNGMPSKEQISCLSVYYADALLAELNNT
jgi:hypothetical protein